MNNTPINTVRYLLVLICVCTLTVQLGASECQAKPNIILVMTDDQGYGPVGRNGHPWIETPHLDKLYDNSTRFTRFQVCPTCSPTRSTLMTGRHAMRNGITHTINERDRMTLDATILPQILGKAGYATGIFGKWHLGDEDPYQPHNRGFDTAFVHGAGGIGQAYKCSNADAPGNKYFDPVVRHNGSFVRTHGFCTDVFFTAALDWIKTRKANDEPFFAYITTNAPHGPFIAPEADAERFLKMGFGKTQAGFYGMIENIDDNMGRLMTKLEEWQLLDDTVVIFMSDNGMTGNGSGRLGKVLGTDAKDNELYPYNAGMKGLKNSVEEGGVRVPLFVRWDGEFTPGRDISELSAGVDILPTLVEIAGGELPENQVEGRSLLPLLKDADADWPDRYLFTHQGRWPVGAEPNDYQWKNFSVRNARFRYVKGTELFDMLADPGQTKNVIDQHPDVVADMRKAYDAWWKKTRPMMVNEGVPMSPVRPYHVAYEKQLAEGGIPEWKPRNPRP